MNQVAKQEKKQEIISVKNIDQISKHNQKVENFYKKIESDKVKIHAKIAEAKERIRELERQEYTIYHKATGIDAPNKIWMGDRLEIERKAFEGVTHSALLLNYETYQQTRIYKKNGFWVTIQTRYPSLADGRCDDEHPFIVEEKVQLA